MEGAGREPCLAAEGTAWLARVLEKHGVVRKVRKALARDPVRSHATVRAAAWVLAQVGRPGTWPEETLVADLDAAIAALKTIEERVFADEEEFRAAVQAEASALRDRRAELS